MTVNTLRGAVKRFLFPEYRVAEEKRELERYLRSQGWSRKEALEAVAEKYGRAKKQ